MALKTRLICSPNFDLKKRKSKDIKFLIFHYTGMKSEKAAIKKLTEIQSVVSAHYLIKKNGEIIRMVPNLYVAWHTGISQWGKYKLLNKNSIGVELTNPGHQFGYTNFSYKQIKSLIMLTKFLIKKYKINKNCILGHSDISPERKLDPGEKFPWMLMSKKKIGIWHNISKKSLNIFRDKNVPSRERIIFIRNLKKIGYPSKRKILKSKLNFEKMLIKAFQRRFRPERINGKIDKECLLISTKLTNINK